jgi:serine protease
MRLRAFLPAVLALMTVAAAPEAAAAPPYVPGEVIVKYKDGTTATERTALERHTGTQPDELLLGGSRQLQIEDGESVPETLAELERDPDVVYAVPNFIVRAAAFPNDPGYGRQWNLWGRFGIRMPEAWTLARASGAAGGRGAIVAVLDTGVAYRRFGRRYRRVPDLRRFVRGHDFIHRDPYPLDANGHGTHVAGTIGQSTGNGIGVAGIGYRIRIMPVRVLDAQGYGNTVGVANAIRWAARHGADVINLSIEFDPRVSTSQIPNIAEAVRYARRRGIPVVGAAGNSGALTVAQPARVPGVIAVAATTRRGCQAEFSNSGNSVDLAAPGGGDDAPNDDNAWDAAHCQIGTVSRWIYQQTFACDPLFSGSRCLRRFALTPGYEGTSMAAAHVSGVAALVIASGRLGRDPSARAVERHLERTARDLGPRGFDRRYGHGLVDAAAALR